MYYLLYTNTSPLSHVAKCECGTYLHSLKQTCESFKSCSWHTHIYFPIDFAFYKYIYVHMHIKYSVII